MSKTQFYSLISIDEAHDAMMNYEDCYYLEFRDLVFKELLKNIKKTPFKEIIESKLQYGNKEITTNDAHALKWLFTADRKIIDTETVYSFRYANPCDPGCYCAFKGISHPDFKPITFPRHRYNGWFEFVGCELLKDIGEYLNISDVVPNGSLVQTKLFINPEQERIDIQFHFDRIKTRIAITFESGYPAS